MTGRGPSSAATVADRDVVVSRFVAAPVALVWRAWTEAERLARWWGPDGATATVEVLEPRPGGALRLSIVMPDGTAHPCAGTFRDVVAERRLVIDGDPSVPGACGAGLPPGAEVTVGFEPRAGGTEVTIATRFPSADARAAALANRYDTGWPESLDRLAADIGEPPTVRSRF